MSNGCQTVVKRLSNGCQTVAKRSPNGRQTVVNLVEHLQAANDLSVHNWPTAKIEIRAHKQTAMDSLPNEITCMILEHVINGPEVRTWTDMVYAPIDYSSLLACAHTSRSWRACVIQAYRDVIGWSADQQLFCNIRFRVCMSANAYSGAIARNNMPVVHWIKSCGYKAGQCALYVAVEHGYTHIVEWIRSVMQPDLGMNAQASFDVYMQHVTDDIAHKGTAIGMQTARKFDANYVRGLDRYGYHAARAGNINVLEWLLQNEPVDVWGPFAVVGAINTYTTNCERMLTLLFDGGVKPGEPQGAWRSADRKEVRRNRDVALKKFQEYDHVINLYYDYVLD